jgi:hypothetical protein
VVYPDDFGHSVSVSAPDWAAALGRVPWRRNYVVRPSVFPVIQNSLALFESVPARDGGPHSPRSLRNYSDICFVMSVYLGIVLRWTTAAGRRGQVKGC